MTDIEFDAGPADGAVPQDGVGLCLSGGGYRAMLFHLGVVWRLHEARVLPKLTRISSVSGGSITAACLALNWRGLVSSPDPDTSMFERMVVAPIRGMAEKSIDVSSTLRGLFWFGSSSDRIAAAYRKHLFGEATLQDLPEAPRFVINATNVQTGSLWRFSRPFMGDWRIGLVRNPTTDIATAVAASSAFPPVLSPTRLRIEQPFDPSTVPDGAENLQRPPFSTRVVLSDGGVYDNLGLETLKTCRTLLVSDAGAALAREPAPKSDWARHSYRVLSVIDNQVRSLRKRHLIADYRAGRNTGAFWSIRGDILDYGLDDALPCPFARMQALANYPTRLKKVPGPIQEQLINWGYAISDAALRRHAQDLVDGPPPQFPYPDAG